MIYPEHITGRIIEKSTETAGAGGFVGTGITGG
jgi:hypothetical protein